MRREEPVFAKINTIEDAYKFLEPMFGVGEKDVDIESVFDTIQGSWLELYEYFYPESILNLKSNKTLSEIEALGEKIIFEDGNGNVYLLDPEEYKLLWEQDEQEHDMGEMYGLPHGASSDYALKFFESRQVKSSADLYDFTYEDENGFDRHAFYAEENNGSFEVTDRDPQYKEVRIGDIITVADAKDMGLEWKEVLASSRKPIKSSPNYKKFTADEIFDSFDTQELLGTVFMDKDDCINNHCGTEDLSDRLYDVLPGYLGVYTIEDAIDVCNKAKNPKAKSFKKALELAEENARWTDKYYSSIKLNKKSM